MKKEIKKLLNDQKEFKSILEFQKKELKKQESRTDKDKEKAIWVTKRVILAAEQELKLINQEINEIADQRVNKASDKYRDRFDKWFTHLSKKNEENQKQKPLNETVKKLEEFENQLDQTKIYAFLEVDYIEGDKFKEQGGRGFEPQITLFASLNAANTHAKERVASLSKNYKEGQLYWDEEWGSATLHNDQNEWCYMTIFHLENPFTKWMDGKELVKTLEHIKEAGE